MTQKISAEPSLAQDAVVDLQSGLDNAKRLVERTRFLLAGDAPGESAGLVADPAQAASAERSEIVQNPAAE